MSTTKENTVSDGASSKPAAAKAKPKAAAKPAEDENARLLAEQAEEERVARAEAADEAERARVADLPDAADGEHNGSIADAVLEAARGAKVQMLSRIYEQRHPGAGGVPPDDVLLSLEEILLAPEPAPEPELQLSDELGLGELPPAVLAILAQQSAQTAALTEALSALSASVNAGATGQAKIEGSVEDLVRSLEGTVSDGGDGDDPLDEAVTFVSKGANLKIIYKPRYRGTGPGGEQFFTTGIAADFAPTGNFTTRNRQMVAYLRSRPGFNLTFWELGAEPFSAPNPKLVFDKIIQATLELDDATLAKLEEDEKASHKRQAVLDTITMARTRIQGFTSGGA